LELNFGLELGTGFWLANFTWVFVSLGWKLLQGTCFQGLQTSLGSLFNWVANFFKELAFGLEIQA
jgi:hypothetical protein